MTMKALAYLICYCIYPFSFLLPRNRRKWAFGSFKGAFNDNAKYLFLHVSEQVKEVNCAWLSANKVTIRRVRLSGLKAYHVLSLQGIWFALTSKYWFYNAYSSDIMYCLSGRAVKVNLWHGLPLKRIEFDIDSGPLADRFVKKKFKERYFHPETFQRPDYVLSSTRLFSEIFARSFRIPIDRCLEFGYPRNEILTWTEDVREMFVRHHEPEVTQRLIERIQQGCYSRVFIYLPTWRESQRDLFIQHFDLDRLDSLMKEQGSLLLLKPHANTPVDPSIVAHLTRVELLPADMDIYPVLPYTDVLITDYSSVLFDYALMPQKEIIIYLYDYQLYKKDRNFTYPIEELTIGRRVFDFETLLSAIRENVCLEEQERVAYVEKCWGIDISHASTQISVFFSNPLLT